MLLGEQLSRLDATVIFPSTHLIIRGLLKQNILARALVGCLDYYIYMYYSKLCRKCSVEAPFDLITFSFLKKKPNG